MKLSLSVLAVALVAARGAAASAGHMLFGLQPPGLRKGTFSREVADKVAAFRNMRPSTNHGGSSGGSKSNPPVPTNGWGTFTQILDHDNPHLGTFSQRFWYSTTYWQGPGSPVILANPGEQSGEGWNDTYLTNQRITGLFAEAVGGAIVILEHRYFGESAPFADLTVDHLRYLTIDNALRDMTYFAETFVPPFDASGRSSPATAPWVLLGGSYSGALAGWAANLAASEPEAGGPRHGTSPFWAYYATGGVVEAIGDFWQYFDMVRQGSPANCSADLAAAVGYIDSVLQHGTGAQKDALKARFMLEDLVDADFAKAIAIGPFIFQGTQFFLEPLYGVSPYYEFCDYIENMWPGSEHPLPGRRGVGAAAALTGYAKWFTELIMPYLCQALGFSNYEGEYDTGCLQTLNASSAIYQDFSPSNAVSRQYMWLMCNEPIAWFQNAAPAGRPSIVSRLVTTDYYMAVCRILFPPSAGGFGLLHGRTPADVNRFTGGWAVPPSRTPRVLYANGEVDPWRAASVSSPWRPGGPLASSPNVRVHVVPGGGHCSDAYAENWAVNAGVKAVADAETAVLAGWIAEFYRDKGIHRPS